MKSLLRWHSAAAVLLLTCAAAFAQEEEQYELTPEEQAQVDQIVALVDQLDRQTGAISLLDGVATLNIPEEFYFLDAEDAETVLVDIWGNPPGQGVLGMIFPANYSPLDYDSWAVTLDYVDDGYVSDDDAHDIDYDDLLEDMQDDTRDANADREAAGYGAVELLGWAEPPHYDSVNKQLYWAKELAFDGTEDTVLNYEIRTLGRRGMLMMTFIAGSHQLDAISASRATVLGLAEFNEGSRYADFDPDIDEVAAYGLGALVAGKVAAKAGILGALLLILKKFGIFFLIGLAAFGKKIKGLFSRKKPDAE